MESELGVKFTTRSELQGAEQALTSLQKQIGAAKALGESYAELEAKAKKVEASIAQSKGSEKSGLLGGLKDGLRDIIPGFEKVEEVVGKLVSGPLGLLAAGFAAVAGAIKLAHTALEEYAQQEDAVASVNAALAQNQILSKENSEAYQELANSLQDVTAIADEKWLAVLARLTQFGAKPENIENYSEAVKNLAGVIGGDISTAGELFSKALQGNFTMLSRYGIHVEEAGTQTEKLEKLMAELAQRGGGQLEARAQTLNGKMAGLKNSFMDALKGLGGWIASTGVAQTVTQGLTDTFSYYAEALHRVVPIQHGLENAIQTTNQAMAESPEEIKRYTDALAEHFKKLGTELDADIARLRLIEQLTNQMEDAKLAKDIAEIEAEAEAGNMTPAQRDAAISKRKGESLADKNLRRQNTLSQEYQKNQDAIQGAGDDIDKYQQQIEETKQRLGQRQSYDQALASVAKAHALVEESRGRNNEAQKSFDAGERRAWVGSNPWARGDALDIRDGAKTDLESNQSLLEQAQKRLQSAATDRPSQTASELQASLNKLTVALQTAQKNFEVVPGLRRRNQDIEAESQFGQRTYESERDANRIRGATEVDKANKAERDRQQHEMQKEMEERARAFKEGNPFSQVIDDHADTLIGAMQKFADKLNLLDADVQKIAGQVNNQRNV